MKKNLSFEICRAMLILLFAYTATSKFLDYNLFVFQMMRAPMPLMRSVAPVLGWLMPIIEASLVLALIIFEIYIIAMLLSGLNLPCTCGGIISTMSWKQHLILNAVFISFGMMAIFHQKNIRIFQLSLLRKKNSKEPSRVDR